jgi:hypothetical protein
MILEHKIAMSLLTLNMSLEHLQPVESNIIPKENSTTTSVATNLSTSLPSDFKTPNNDQPPAVQPQIHSEHTRTHRRDESAIKRSRDPDRDSDRSDSTPMLRQVSTNGNQNFSTKKPRLTSDAGEEQSFRCAPPSLATPSRGM